MIPEPHLSYYYNRYFRKQLSPGVFSLKNNTELVPLVVFFFFQTSRGVVPVPRGGSLVHGHPLEVWGCCCFLLLLFRRSDTKEETTHLTCICLPFVMETSSPCRPCLGIILHLQRNPWRQPQICGVLALVPQLQLNGQLLSRSNPWTRLASDSFLWLQKPEAKADGQGRGYHLWRASSAHVSALFRN